MSITVEWEEGDSITTPDGSQSRLVEDSGRVVRNFTDVNVTFDPWKADGQALVLPVADETHVQAHGTGESEMTILHGTRLAKSGYSKDRAEAGDESGTKPGFQYDTPTPVVSHSALDRGTAQGDFALFVNNVTLTAEPDAESSWSTWSGLRVENQAATVDEYELRVVTINVTSGNLSTQIEDNLMLFGRSIATSWDGSLDARGAEGTISLPHQEERIRGDRLKLGGDGEVSATAAGLGAERGTTSLDVSVIGPFRVLSADREAFDSPSAAAGPEWIQEQVLWFGLAAATAILLLVAAIPRQKPALLRHLPVAWRRPLYERWRTRARNLENDGEFAAAAQLYHRAAQLFPNKPGPWFHEALLLLDAGDHQAALEAAETSRSTLGEIAPLDLLEVKVAAASKLGDDQTAREGLIELAENAPRMARGLIDDLSLHDLADDPQLREALDDRVSPGGLDGYV